MKASRRVSISIRWVVAGSAACLTAIAVLAASAITERRTRDVLASETESRLLAQARGLAIASSGALLTEYPEFTLAPLLTKMQTEEPELALLVVVDRSGEIQGHPDVRRIGSRYAAPARLEPMASRTPLTRGEALSQNHDLIVAAVPILGGAGQVLGQASLGLRRSYVDAALAKIGRQQVLIVGSLLILALATSFLLLSVLLRPLDVLRRGLERIGRGELDVPLRVSGRTEFALLAETVNEMAAAVKGAQIEMVERERLVHEMDLARQIQRSLLPREPIVAGEFVIAGEQWAAAEVGGDYYDMHRFPDGTVAIAIADVAGKGLAGCLVSSMLSCLIRALRPVHASPAALLTALDERLGEILQRGSFVTMFYGVLDPTRGRLTFASAGHNPVLVYRARGRELEWHETSGIPLAAVRGGAIRTTLEDCVLELGPGDVLIQTTDGVNEAMAPDSNAQFGLERVESIALARAPLGARAVLEHLHQAVVEWRSGGAPSDDETLLVVSREGGKEPMPHREGGRKPMPHRAASKEPATAAIHAIVAARERGGGLRLPATFESLTQIETWVSESGVTRDVPAEAASLLTLALYEVCANIVEHGYAMDALQSLELCRVTLSDPTSGSGATSATTRFIICDRGQPFRPDPETRADLEDPTVRRRGRGLGLELIYRSMQRVDYFPGTEHGNLTVLDWTPPVTTTANEELRHA